MNVVWNAFHIDSQRLPFSLNIDSERTEKFWESEGTKCMETWQYLYPKLKVKFHFQKLV